MIRVLNLIMILAILTTQSAWAIHGDDLDPGGSTQSYTQHTEQHNEASDACNHFCHASAHLVGLFSTNTIELQNSCDSHEIAVTNLNSSLSYQPPIPPPIS